MFPEELLAKISEILEDIIKNKKEIGFEIK